MMDTTPEYIKMSKKAEEVQRNHKPARGDLYKCACNSCRRKNADIFMIGEEDIDCLKKRDLTNTWRPYAEIVQASEVGGFVAYYTQRTNEYLSYIWLSHQHQLQEMVYLHTEGWVVNLDMLQQFYNFVTVGIYPDRPIDNFLSMEQLWLAFVMHKKYNKYWDGSEWKREEER